MRMRLPSLAMPSFSPARRCWVKRLLDAPGMRQEYSVLRDEARMGRPMPDSRAS